VAAVKEIEVLQNDLHKMFDWLLDWQMLFGPPMVPKRYDGCCCCWGCCDRFRKMPKALLIHKLRNFAYTFVTSFLTDLPSLIFLTNLLFPVISTSIIHYILSFHSIRCKSCSWACSWAWRDDVTAAGHSPPLAARRMRLRRRSSVWYKAQVACMCATGTSTHATCALYQMLA